MLRAVKSVTKFLIVFSVMTVINAIVWEFVAGDLERGSTIAWFVSPCDEVNQAMAKPLARTPFSRAP
jgi:hypothetical protein